MFPRNFERLAWNIVASLWAFAIATSAPAAPLFDDNTMLALELHGPRADLIKKRKKEQNWPFTLVTDAGSQDILVRARGNSRLRICKLPPIRFQFDGVQNNGTVFHGLKKLKLVVPCRRGEAAQSDVVQEYLAYRIFNLLTDTSYRVRLLRITFVETENDNSGENENVFGFAIEPRKVFADRIGAKAVDLPGVSLASLNREHMAKVYVFQYLIGNTDWSLVTADGDDVCCHNGEMHEFNKERYYIPYDFDLTGLVNAKYAYPDASLSIKRVTQRLYRGFCMPREALTSALVTTKMKLNEILQELDDLPGIDDKERAKTRKFIEDFFDEAKDQENLLDEFERQCL